MSTPRYAITKEWFSRRFITLVVVVALHFLFLLLLLVREPIARRVVHSEPSSVLFFVERPRPAATTSPRVPVRGPRAAIIAEPKTPEATSSEPIEPASPSALPIDWTAQATESAAAIIDKAIHEESRKCDPADSPNSFLPPCKHKTKEFEWTPGDRVGFNQGLPYVKVGERCVIGLGFFGCGFGAKPPANGDLFEGMDDPERDRSSVPSPNP